MSRIAQPTIIGAGALTYFGMAVASALVTQGSAWAQGTTATAPSSPVTPGAPAVAAEAERLLKDMGAYIGSAEQFTFHADITFDQVLPSGQKLQFASAEDVALKRPGRLYVEWNGDLGTRHLWYDGTSVTLFDPTMPFYASAAAPPEIDATLEKLIGEFDFSPPLVDFLYRDPYEAVRRNVQYAFDLGRNDVSGRSCRTLAFVEKDIDWQIWIENGPQLTPCKLVITYKTRPAQPQFTAIFSGWDFAPRIAESMFAPTLPPGSEKIPLATLASSK